MNQTLYTHAFRNVENFLKLLPGATIHHSRLAHTHTHTKISHTQDTCVINKVGIGVDVFGEKERRERWKKKNLS